MGKRRTILCKRAISFFVTGLVTIACLPAGFSVTSAAWNRDVDTGRYHTGETELSISNAAELAGLAKLVNSGTNFEGVTITLEADLQMNQLMDWEKWETNEVTPANSWTPIGIFDECIFHGTFDGNYHTISGLYVESAGKKGLFTAIASDATVKNLKLEKSYLSSTDDYAGGICAYNYRGTIQNCHNDAIVSSWYYTAGGICGANYFGVVSQCSNEAFISASMDAGGIAGINFCATIAESCNTGKVSSKKCGGGIAGEESNGEIQNCYNTGSIKGGQAAAGIVGKYNEGALDNCYNIGSITGANTVGGIVGAAAAHCDNCYYLSGVVENTLDSDSCTIMKKADMQKIAFAEQLGNAYSGVNGSYPLLEWEQNMPGKQTTVSTTSTTTTATKTETTVSSQTVTTAKTTVTDTIHVATVNNVREIHQIGGTLQLFLLGTTEKPLWLSTDESIATIDENGLVTAVSEGSVMVGATVNNKFYKLTITIDVLETTTDVTTTGTTTQKITTTAETTTFPTTPTATISSTTTLTATTPPKETTVTHVAYEKGDVDGNCAVNVEDAVAVLTYYAKRSAGMDPIFSESPMQHAKAMIASDVDGDSVISVEDAVAILTYYARQSAGLNPDWSEIVNTVPQMDVAEETLPEENMVEETEMLPEEQTDLPPTEATTDPIA